MKALVFDGNLRFADDYPVPKRSSNEALVRVLMAGICRTDIEIVKGYMDFRGVLGHEFVGVVEECDERTWLGKRVVGEINCGCGMCEYCQRGEQRHCPQRTVLGILNRDGAFAEYLTLPTSNLHEVPTDVPTQVAVFTEPLSAAFEILEQMHISPSQSVLVLGDGKLGILVAQVLRLTGCSVMLVGKHQCKLEVAQRCGVKAVKREHLLSSGRIADVVIDCTGSPTGLTDALQFVRPRGTVVLKTTTTEQTSINMAQMVIDEVTIIGSRCGPYAPAMRALSDKMICVEPLISAIYSLDDGIHAFSVATQSGVLKVLLDCAT